MPPAHDSVRNRSQLTGAATALLICALAWGAFAFGGVYQWAYWPLAVVAVAAAAVGSFARSPIPRLEHRGLAASFAVFLLAGVVQVIPLPFDMIGSISPEAPKTIKQFNPMASLGLVDAHALSIAPLHTRRGLLVCGSLLFLVIGGSRLFSMTGVRGIARAITVLGVLLAFAGIIYRLLANVYGFSIPRLGHSSFGPFINRNHFAGWMLMALPVTLGLITGSIARSRRGAVSGLRDRVLWLSSPDASRIMLWSAAAALMVLSIILTTSRSGMAVAALVVAITALRALRAGGTMAKRVAGALLVCASAAAIVAWIGADVIAARFGEASWDDFNMRKGAWLDAIDIARRYPLVGTGFNTYGVATLFYQQHDLHWHFAQAHNDYLQLAAEGGLLMVLPAIAALAVFVVEVRRRFRQETSVSTYWIRTGAVTGICAVAVQEIVDFSLQMPGNALLFAMLSAIALHRTPERRPST